MLLSPYLYSLFVLWLILFHPEVMYLIPTGGSDWFSKLFYLSLATGLWGVIAQSSIRSSDP